MTLYVLDTDHLSLYGRKHPVVVSRLEAIKAQLTTTAINAEEQIRGRLAQITEARDDVQRGDAYRWFTETIVFLSAFQVLPYNPQAQTIYQTLKAQRIRIGTQDLRIAAITLAHNGILLTRNLRDFEKISGLSIQNWSVLPEAGLIG